MLTTLARKEIREILPLVIVALLLQIYLVCAATGANLGQLAWILRVLMSRTDNNIPFVGDLYCTAMLVVAGLLAVAVGLWQTLCEVNRGTVQFLLHRPVQRQEVFAAKLLVGVAACLVVAVLPLLYYAVWASTPGSIAAPFDWSMTTSTWIVCLQMPLLYLAAFLSGLGEGRWLGSRALPLAAGLLLLVVLLLGQSLEMWVVCGGLILLLLA
ncbi:MAG TPA: hypothetical protein VFE46_19945, partial [Pirellulales bacterium]|nr:hypothetical protein [Pirellulales bacterium]